MSHLLILIPFVGLIIRNALPRNARVLPAIMWVVIFGFQTVVAALQPFGVIDWSFMAPLEKLIGFTLQVDNLGLLLLASVGIAGLAAALVGHATLKTPRTRFTFGNLLMISLLGINGIAMVRDLFTLFVFVEVTSVAAVILVTLREGPGGFEGAWKYLLLSSVASVFMLASMGFFLLSAGGITFDQAAAALATPNPMAWVAAALFMCGLFVKGAMVPFHGWLADAYTAAPAPVSVFLAGIVTKATGIFALMRLVPSTLEIAGPLREIFLVAGALAAVAGAFLALGQSDMKRMLAYSSISQMGYIVMALGGQPSLALLAAGFHFFNHTVSKAQLFANAAAVEKGLGTRDMDRMGGLAARMPVTGATAAVATLSIAGLPPLAGFWSKLLVVIALWNGGQRIFAVIAILTSLVTLGYFLVLQRKAFFGKILPEWEKVREAGAGLLVPVIALAVITIAVGIGFPFLLPMLLGGNV